MQPLVYGAITVNNSITNSAADKNSLVDAAAPLSFFDFLKYTDATATPKEFNNAYNEYLLKWYEIKGQKDSDLQLSVRDQYIELLKDITINYTTSEEKRFLSNIDFDNPQDLAIAIPFYSSKISNICQFYTKKRERLKHKIEENKIKGTADSVEKKVFDLIVDYIFVDDKDNTYNVSNIALSAISSGLSIEVEEYFDTYSEYFNIDPELSPTNYAPTNVTRETYFTSNTNDIDVDLFVDFDTKLKEDIFGYPIFIKELGDILSINYDSKFIDLECDDDNPIKLIIEENESKSNAKLTLKKKLLEKYIGTDIYYLSTDTTGTAFVSGILFKASEPSKNLLNRRFAATATFPSEQLKCARDIGLFFKPDKLGILYFKTPDKKYKINTEVLEANKVYVFPDPEIYGNISGITEEPYEYPLYFTVDNSSMIKSRAFGFSNGDIYSTPYDQLFFGYISQQNTFKTNQQNLSGLNQNFSSLYNLGIITDWRSDIYGNEYGLLKNIHNYKKNIDNVGEQDSSLNCIVLDGYRFFDSVDGFNIDYSISTGAMGDGSLRTGLTAKTIDEQPYGGGTFSTGYTFSSAAMFNLSGSPVYSLYFREFYPYTECLTVQQIIPCGIYDCGTFTFSDNTLLPDPIPADSEAYNTSLVYYYNELIDCGICNTAELEYCPSGTANFILSIPISAGGQILDGGTFFNDCEVTNKYPYVNGSQYYYNEITNLGSTIIDSSTGTYIERILSEVQALTGNIFVKNAATGNVLAASISLSSIFTKYSAAVEAEMIHVKSFDVVYDRIFITTTNYFIIDKLSFDTDRFITPGTENIVYSKGGDSQFNHISLPYFAEEQNNVYFVRTAILSGLSATNAKTVYPEIFKFDIDKHKVTKIYPTTTVTTQTLSSIFSLSGLNVNITSIDEPSIVHNTRNGIYSISYIGKDGNDLSYIFNTKFRYDGETVVIVSTSVYRFAVGSTYNFYQSTSSSLVSASFISTAPYQTLSSGEYTFN